MIKPRAFVYNKILRCVKIHTIFYNTSCSISISENFRKSPYLKVNRTKPQNKEKYKNAYFRKYL